MLKAKNLSLSGFYMSYESGESEIAKDKNRKSTWLTGLDYPEAKDTPW